MIIKVTILATYFLVVLFIGFWTRTRWDASPESYFLADRKLGPVVLLGTMAATNFSAFTVFGTSGAGYRDGYAFFPIMAFGTGFMALTFWILGRRIWRTGKAKGIVTPPELAGNLYGSRGVSFLFALVMIVFTIPYLALQPIAAGYALEALVGLPYLWGATLVTCIILIYTLRGGLRAVAWTDLLQGGFMVVLLAASLVMIVWDLGGFSAAHAKVAALSPDLFSRPGAMGKYTPAVWFSYMALWFFCDPMFPQLFQRFFSARSERTVSRMMLFYPLLCTVVFFMPIAIGVLGRIPFPDLVGKEADKIVPMMVTLVSGDFMGALVIACGLSALMSTMDSQLLTLSSIFTRDIHPLVNRGKQAPAWAGRVFVVLLSLCGLALAVNPPGTILKIATQTFTGLAVLFPAVLFGLYLKRVFSASALSSIIIGEILVVLYYFKLLPTGGFLPVIPIMAVTFAVYLGTHSLLAMRANVASGFSFNRLKSPYLPAFLGIFLLGMDVWAWGDASPLWLGLPRWVFYFVGLSAAQTVLMLRLLRSKGEEKTSLS